MKSIDEICHFVKLIDFYIKNEYDTKWYKEFNDYRNSTQTYIDYALTDCFMSDKTIPYAAGIVIDILRMKYDGR
jgi:hypothetical protein